jgi:4-hydroxy-tetrahydrodipicolinate synthase
LSETIELTRLAFELDFQGVVVLPPYYFRKAGEEGLFEWFSRLIRAAVPADGALLGYHIPPLTGLGFSLELLRRLKDAFPDRFAGIKDSSHESEFARSLGEAFGPDLLVLSGTDSYLQLAMQHDAQGCITAPANLISPDLRAVWDAQQAGGAAAETQAHIERQRHALEAHPPFPPLLKVLLHRLHDLPRWSVRPPLEELPAGRAEQALREFMQA